MTAEVAGYKWIKDPEFLAFELPENGRRSFTYTYHVHFYSKTGLEILLQDGFSYKLLQRKWNFLQSFQYD